MSVYDRVFQMSVKVVFLYFIESVFCMSVPLVFVSISVLFVC